MHQLVDSLSHYLQGFIHPRWCRISSSIWGLLLKDLLSAEVKRIFGRYKTLGVRTQIVLKYEYVLDKVNFLEYDLMILVYHSISRKKLSTA